jgi:hypothetical protein
MAATAFDFDGFKQLCKETEADGWTKVTEKHGVVVHTKKVSSSPLAISRGVATIAAPTAAVRALAVDADRRCEWDTLLAEFRVLRTISENEKIGYMKSIAKWPVSARDFVIHVKARDTAEETVVLAVKGDNAEMPPQKGVVRGTVINSGFVIEQNPSDPERSTVIYYAIQLDLAGWIPTSIVNQVLADEPLGLIQFRKLITGKEDP